MARGRFKKPKPPSTRVVTTLPISSENIRKFTEFVAAQENRAKLMLRECVFTDIIAAIDTAYNFVRDAKDGKTPGLARFCAVRHQSFFAAAAAIFRGDPHTSAAPTRRGIEAARIALAILLDPENRERWLAFEERTGRWSSRKGGIKPPRLKIHYMAVDTDATGKTLAQFAGSLSDGSLHFTPELLGRLKFRDKGKKLYSEYLEDREAEIATHLALLTAVHLVILKTLDRCAEGRFSRTTAFVVALEGIATSATVLKERYPFQAQAAPAAPELVNGGNRGAALECVCSDPSTKTRSGQPVQSIEEAS